MAKKKNTTPQAPETIITIMDTALQAIEAHGLAADTEAVRAAARYLLDITPRQCVLFLATYSLNLASIEEVRLHDVAQYLHVSDLSLLNLAADWEVLIQKNLVDTQMDTMIDTADLAISEYVRMNIRMNTDLHPSDLRPVSLPVVDGTDTELSTPEFVNTCGNIIWNLFQTKAPTEEILNAIEKFEVLHGEVNLVKELRHRGIPTIDRAFFYQVSDFVQQQGKGELLLKAIQYFYQDNDHIIDYLISLYSGQNSLCQHELITIMKEEELGDSGVELSDKGLDVFLGERGEIFKHGDAGLSNIKKPEDIIEKKLFFATETSAKIAELTSILQEENYRRLVKNLEAARTTTGITCLFYGPPGTGKTESALQIARATGRKLITVNIEDTKSQWYAESEKNVADIFNGYAKLAKSETLKPIMLFNEADAVFARRLQAMQSTDQSDNRIIDVLLAKLDTWDGILIATTNNEDYMDRAFYRRFLYKLKFAQPDRATRAAIMQDKIPSLTPEECRDLAAMELSGSNIDNVVKKLCIARLSQEQSLALVRSLCEEELQLADTEKHAGFRHD